MLGSAVAQMDIGTILCGECELEFRWSQPERERAW